MRGVRILPVNSSLSAIFSSLLLISGLSANLKTVAQTQNVFNFEDLSANTIVQSQYASQGVTFINSGGQLLPIIHRINSIPIIIGLSANIIRLGNNVANFANCFACEFYVPNAAAVLNPGCQAIEMGVGYE